MKLISIRISLPLALATRAERRAIVVDYPLSYMDMYYNYTVGMVYIQAF